MWYSFPHRGGVTGLVVLVGLVLGTLSQNASVAAPATGDARVLFSRMLTVENSITASFTQTEVRVLPKRLETTTEKVWLQSGRRRVEHFESKYARTVLVVNDGKVAWTSISGLPYVLREPSRRKRAETASIADLAMTDLGTEDVGGRAARVVEVVSKTGVRARFWIDATTSLLLQEERYSVQGQPIYSMSRTDLDFSPENVPARFAFTPGAGAKVFTDKRAWRRAVFLSVAASRTSFSVLVPEYVPSGFGFESGDVIEVAKAPVVVSRYRKGDTLLLLFQREAVSTKEKTASAWKKILTRPGGDVAVYEGRQGGFVLTLVGPISEKEAQQVLSSLAPFHDGD